MNDYFHGASANYPRSYKEARERLDSIMPRSDLQKEFDTKDEKDALGLVSVVILDRNEEGEEIIYVTTNADLIHDYCDRLEAERDSN